MSFRSMAPELIAMVAERKEFDCILQVILGTKNLRHVTSQLQKKSKASDVIWLPQILFMFHLSEVYQIGVFIIGTWSSQVLK